MNEPPARLSDLDPDAPGSQAAQFWDARFRENPIAFGAEPNRYLAAQLPRLRPEMRALCLADGQGRNGVWLAEQGLQVTGVDISAVGLRRAVELAEARGVGARYTTEVADLVDWSWPEAAFDVIVSIYFHLGPKARPVVHAQIVRALKPGGLVILEGYSTAHAALRERHGTRGGPPDPRLLFDPVALSGDFAALQTLEMNETEIELAEGERHVGRSAVLRGVWQHPR